MHTHSAVICFMLADQAKIAAILAKHGAGLDGTWHDDGAPDGVMSGQVVQCDSTHDTRMGIALAELESVIGYAGIAAAYAAYDEEKEIQNFQPRCY